MNCILAAIVVGCSAHFYFPGDDRSTFSAVVVTQYPDNAGIPQVDAQVFSDSFLLGLGMPPLTLNGLHHGPLPVYPATGELPRDYEGGAYLRIVP